MARTPAPLPPQARDAVKVLGQQIRGGRIEREWTIVTMAERLEVSPPTVRAIETGSPTVSIGTVLSAATLVGVPLFGVTDPAEIARMRLRGEERLALIKSRVRPAREEPVPDDF